MGRIKTGNPIGAPTKLSKELIEKIASYLRKGAYVETAAAAAGINKKTFYRWLSDGSKKKSGLRYDFCHAIEKAQAYAELKDLNVIDKASALGQWKASAWRLERRNPKRWGLRQTVEHLNSEDNNVQLSDEDLNKEYDRLNAILDQNMG